MPFAFYKEKNIEVLDFLPIWVMAKSETIWQLCMKFENSFESYTNYYFNIKNKNPIGYTYPPL